MSIVNFVYEGQKISVQCKKDEQMKEICQKLGFKTNINLNNYYLISSGKTINLDSKLEEIMGEIDPNNILVLNTEESYNEDNTKFLTKSREVICPTCKEICRMDIKNYKISLSNCKNGHIINNIPLDKYYNTQIIDESNIKCGNSCKITKAEAFKGKFYKCLICKINLCPLCFSKHDKEHIIINYDKKNYVCEKHGEILISYCDKCKINLCMQCEIEHIHKQIDSYKNIIPNKDEVENNLKEFKIKIDKLDENIEEIIKMINKVRNNLNLLFNIYQDFLINYKIENRNYEKLKNISLINNIDYNYIDKIINNDDIFIKFKNIIDIHNIMEKKENKLNKMKMVYNTKNSDIIKIVSEKFIKNNKDNCKIIINGNERELSEFIDISSMGNNGEIEVQLKETKTITNMNHIFFDCFDLISLPDFSEWDTSNVTSMQSLFNGCNSLTNLSDISKWNIENVKTIKNIFWGCKKLTQLPDISKWNTSNMTDIKGAFDGCMGLLSLPDISKWDISKVVNMNSVFNNCISLKSLPDISNWNTNNVTDMSNLFQNCKSLDSFPNISKWNIDKVENFNNMFKGCKNSIIPEKFKYINN